MNDEVLWLPPFRRRDAARHGLTDADYRRHVDRGDLVHIARGIVAGRGRVEHATSNPEREALRAKAMLKRYPLGLAAQRTAAAIHDQWIIGAPGRVHLYRAAGWPREKYDVRVDRVSVPAAHMTYALGVPLTTSARTAVDLTAGTPDMELQAIFDSTLRLGVTKNDLRNLIDELGAIRRGVEDLIGHADARSESPLESISRWLYRTRGLPTPEIQVPFADEVGLFARVDFFWREQGLIGEADGELKYDEAGEAKRAEEERQKRLEALGFTVIRWRWEDVMIHPQELVTRLRGLLEG